MKTRFDGTLWIGAGGQAFRPAEMGTDHLLNTVKMLKNRPGVVIAMVVRDIEATPDCCPFDPFGGGHSELVKQSLFNITSLSPEQVSDYALNSPLGMAMVTAFTRPSRKKEWQCPGSDLGISWPGLRA